MRVSRADQPDPLREQQVGGRVRMRPHKMDRVEGLTVEQAQATQRIALSIFTDMSNAGYSLRESLSAIYFSGAQHAVAVLTERDT